MSSPRTSVLALALLALGAGLAACGKPPARKPSTPEAGYVVIQSQSAALSTELPGRTSPYAISEVRPQVNGILLERAFTEGSNVKKGQLLYRIDPAPYRATLNQAKAQLANAQANEVTLKLKADRYGDLVKIKAVSQQDYDDAKAAYLQADASVQQAKATVDSAQINVGYTDIRSPITGRVGRSTITQGALVTSGQTDALTTVQTLDPIYVDLTQSAAELLRLEREVAQGRAQKGGALAATIKLTLEDGSIYPLNGKLEFTDVTEDQNSGAVTLRAVVPNPKGVLLPGMFVRARIVEAVAGNAILAPQQGVTRDPKGGASVLVLDAQNKAQSRPVEVGQAIGADWLVTKGLQPGDKVITEGLQRIQPGMTVKPVPAGSAPAQSKGPAPGKP